jgi:hypothetical protein
MAKSPRTTALIVNVGREDDHTALTTTSTPGRCTMCPTSTMARAIVGERPKVEDLQVGLDD